MQRERFRHLNDVENNLKLIRALEAGELDYIECPNCHQSAISVWFTHPAVHEYRTWFICRSCTFELRVQNSNRPAYYSSSRMYDSDLLNDKLL